MNKTIGKFLARIRQRLLQARTDREIFQKIFPHFNGDADHGYPFDSRDALVALHIRGNLHAGLNLRRIERTAARLPKAYGDAFRYVAYRELNERMQMYLEVAERRLQPETCDPRLAATRA